MEQDKEITGKTVAKLFKEFKEKELTPDEQYRAEKIKEILQPVVDAYGKKES